MDDYGICSRCESTEFADDLVRMGDWLLCEICMDDI